MQISVVLLAMFTMADHDIRLLCIIVPSHCSLMAWNTSRLGPAKSWRPSRHEESAWCLASYLITTDQIMSDEVVAWDSSGSVHKQNGQGMHNQAVAYCRVSSLHSLYTVTCIDINCVQLAQLS